MNESGRTREGAASAICIDDFVMLRDAYIQSRIIREDFESNLCTCEMRATATSIRDLFANTVRAPDDKATSHRPVQTQTRGNRHLQHLRRSKHCSSSHATASSGTGEKRHV